jgi:hypothetical protein
MRKFTSTDKQNITSRLFAFCLLIGTLMFMDSCRDATELDIPVPAPETENTRAELQPVVNPDGLIQQTDRTWKAVGKRVPLVGVGRVVNSFGSPLLEVIDGKSDNFGKIVDTDIDNYTSFTTSGVNANLASSELISVRDIYRTYTKGQQVGFTYVEKSDVSVLNVNLLKKMKIILRKDGEDVQTTSVSGENDALGVNLLSLGALSGDKWAERSISVIAKVNFDEVALDLGGTNISVLSGFQLCVKYAFVGENPEIIACEGNPLDDYWTGGPPAINPKKTQEIKNEDYIVDSDYVNNYAKDNSILGLLKKDVRATVNFNRNIPLGTEIGFKYRSSSLLGLNVLGNSGPALNAFNDNSDNVQSLVPPISLLGVGLSGKTDYAYASMMVDEEESVSQLQIRLSKSILSSIIGGLLDILLDGDFYIYYAYVREPVTVDVSSYFSIDDTEIYKSDYELPASSDEGNVYYNMITQPYGANATVSGNTLTGATKEGAYVIQAIYTDNKTGKQVSHVFTIYRRTSTSAGSGSKYITNASHGAYPSEPLNNDGGCLLCLFNNVNSLNAIVDNNLDNYAVYTQVLGLAENTPLAAIELTKPVNSVLKNIRTGFVVQANSGLLDVSLLNNLEIRLYNNGELIETGNAASTGTDVLGVDLISGGNDKFRVYVNTNQQFDRIELWAKQGVGLSLFNNFRMYGVFYEDADEKQTSANEVCMEVMNYLNHGLEIDYDRTGESGGLANVNLLGGTTYGLSNLLDNDLNTGMSVSSLLKLGLLKGDLQVALKFNEMPVSSPIGVVLEADGGLLGSNLTALGNNVSVSILSDGQEICIAQKASVLDLNLLESEKRIYFELIPEYNLEDGVSADYYDGIVISLGGGLLDLSLNEIKVTGIYTRVDSDGDGIPDCVDTEKEVSISITEDAHTCEGEPLVIPIVTEAAVGSEYLLSFENLTSGVKYDKVVAISESDGVKAFSVDGLPYGKYNVDVVSLGSGEVLVSNAKAYVHAQLTEWMGKNDTDWNNWGNWTKGAPWHCTDVIIRKDAMKYPELKSGVTNCCDRIHFEAGAMLVRSDLLTYYKAFVDVQLKGGEYNYFVSPLQATVTGDMFINPTVSWTKDKYFTMPDAGNYPQMRTSPVVYQQASVKAYDFDGNGNKPVSDVIDDEFTQDFNGVNHQYSEAALYKVKPGDDTGASYCFRLPKDYNEYDYFSPNGVSKNLKETITRAGTVGQLFTEDFSTVSKYHTAFIPNPYMSYIKVEIPEGATVRSYSDGTYYTVGNVGGSKISTGNDIIISGSLCYIPPMSGIVVETTNNSSHLSFKVSPDMQCAKPEKGLAPAAARNSRTSATAISEPHGVLRVVAEKDERVSSCVLYRSSEASNSLKEGEDVRTMVDAIEAPVVAVFSMADGKAADIQQFSDSEQINLGLIVRRSGTVKLKFKHDGSWDDWYLLDRQTSRVYFLNEAVEVVLENATSGNNRLSLIKK